VQLTCVLIYLTLIGCHHPSQQRSTIDPNKPFTIFGRVIDESGRPIENARIIVNSGAGTLLGHSEGTTDRDGNFYVPFGCGIWFQPDGEHGTVGFQYAVVFVSKKGMAETNLCRQGSLAMSDYKVLPDDYAKQVVAVLKPGDSRRVDFEMAPAASVQGVLVDENSQPLAERSVCLTGPTLPPACSVLAQVHTDSRGQFRFDSLNTDRQWQFETSIPGDIHADPKTELCTMDRPQVYHVRLTLRPIAQIESEPKRYELRIAHIAGGIDDAFDNDARVTAPHD
jgi:hypothetical protein